MKTLFIITALLLCQPAFTCGAKKAGKLDLDTATLEQVSAALAANRVSSFELVSGYLARIRECDANFHAIIGTNPNALAEAKLLDAERRAGKTRGPLHGVPVILKDNIDLAGMVTTAGSLALTSNRREHSAPVAASLVAAGAIVIAKANLSEWANFRSRFSSSGWSAVGGLAVNAHDTRRTACGSSSGAAVAIVARFAPATVGTETNGSIVCPSSVNGVVGLKPTVGLVPAEGIVPISHSQDTAGPMTATVADAALLLTAMVARADKPATNYHAELRADALRGVRLGVARFVQGFSPRTERAFDAALEVLKAQGAVLVEIRQFDFAEVRDLQLPILLTEFKAGINAYLATTPAAVKSRTLADLIAFNRVETRELQWFGQDLFEQSEATAGLEDPAYQKALQRARTLAGEQGIDRLLRENRVVALVAPTTGPAWMIDLVNGDRSVGSASTLAAVSGYPHLTVPMTNIEGLPIGLSFFAGARSEQELLSLGYSFELARGALAPSSR
ncbi:MAG: amidase [Steroidobacteraceae bacterium]|nr:amidase [Steroidobacteraceae bacterium]